MWECHVQGYDAVTASKKGLMMMYQIAQAQAGTVSFVNAFFIMSIAVACLVPLPWVMRRAKTAKPAMDAAH